MKSAATLTKDEVIKRLRNLVKITNESPEMGGWTPALSVVEAEVMIGLLEASAPPAAERTASADVAQAIWENDDFQDALEMIRHSIKEEQFTAYTTILQTIKSEIDASEGTKSE